MKLFKELILLLLPGPYYFLLNKIFFIRNNIFIITFIKFPIFISKISIFIFFKSDLSTINMIIIITSFWSNNIFEYLIENQQILITPSVFNGTLINIIFGDDFNAPYT